MTDQYLNTNQLNTFAPNSPILAFRPHDTGSPQEDWCKHLQENPCYRRELEEFSILGDVAVRIADGVEPKPFERVKILSLEYAVRTLKDETDAKEFVRCVKAIVSPDADQWELGQINGIDDALLSNSPMQTKTPAEWLKLLNFPLGQHFTNFIDQKILRKL